MDAVGIVGWAGVVVGTVLALPQVFRLLRTRDVQGVSVPLWQVTLAINLAWLVHGVRFEQLNMVVVNALAMVSTLVILTVLSRELPRGLTPVFAPGLLIAGAMIAVDLSLPSAVFGLVAAVPAVAGQLTQSVELIRARRVVGVSFWFLLFGFLNFATWAVWGSLAGDQAVVLASVVTALPTLFNVVWLVLRAAGLGPIGRPPIEDATFDELNAPRPSTGAIGESCTAGVGPATVC